MRTANTTAAPHQPGTAEYQRWKSRQIGYGRWHPWAPAQPSRTLVRQCMDAGVGLRRFADLSGVPYSTLSMLIYGQPAKFRLPSAQVRQVTAAAIATTAESILAAVAEAFAAGKFVDSTGSRRRAQGLVTKGHTPQRIATAAGVSAIEMRRLIRGELAKVTVATERGIRRACDLLWLQEPPRRTRYERTIATRTQRWGKREGWPLPAAWDEDLIDNPAATAPGTPGVLGGRWTRHTRPDDGDIDEIAVELVATGEALRMGHAVPLSGPERRAAAEWIIAAGGTAALLGARLRINGTDAAKLYAEVVAAVRQPAGAVA